MAKINQSRWMAQIGQNICYFSPDDNAEDGNVGWIAFPTVKQEN